MILVRDVFQLKFGQARDALAAFKQIAEIGKGLGLDPANIRLLTDLVGPHYTLVLEATFPNLGSWEQAGQKIMGNQEWRNAYQKFVPHVESGHREIFNIVS